MYLSTSPSSEPTHWKQTIAFLPEAISSFSNGSEKLTFNEGDSFECYVVMNQSEENSRFYEIDIGVDLKIGTEKDEDEEEEEDENEGIHPVPCDCGKMRCLLIKATLEKYETQK